jgi:LysM repeat protein
MSVATEFAPSVPLPDYIPGSVGPNRPAVLPAPLATITVLRPPSARSVAAPVRLTRRGMVVLALAVVALGAALVWVAALSAPSSGTAPARGPAVVTVQSGDTLWSIAQRVAPQSDPRAEVATLQRLNQLSGVGLTPGQQLRVH